MICNAIDDDVYCTAAEGLLAILSMPLHLCSGAAVLVDTKNFFNPSHKLFRGLL
jgi:hypothetical protein